MSRRGFRDAPGLWRSMRCSGEVAAGFPGGFFRCPERAISVWSKSGNRYRTGDSLS